jgi:hypothetical protein
MPLVFRGAGKPLPKTLAKSEKRRFKAEFRVAFSLDTFFWPKIAPAFSAFARSLWLAKQKKVSRLSGRQIGRKADLHAKHPQGEKQGSFS